MSEQALFLLEILSDGDWISNEIVMSRLHRRFGSPAYKPALRELREAGAVVDTSRVGPRETFAFRLISGPTQLDLFSSADA